MVREQILSPCGRYQYQLAYQWGYDPACAFILLNPSCGEGREPTSRSCIRLAQQCGFGGLVIFNRFAYRTTSPNDLLTVEDPFGPDNAVYLAELGSFPIRVAGWGSHRAIRKLNPPLPEMGFHAAAVNKDGAPRHPLYITTGDLQPWPNKKEGKEQ